MLEITLNALEFVLEGSELLGLTVAFHKTWQLASSSPQSTTSNLVLLSMSWINFRRCLLYWKLARRGEEWLSNSINSNAFYTPRARLSILNPLVHDCLSVLKDKLLMGMEGEESRMRQIETTPPPSTGSWTGTTLTHCLVISELTKFKMKACGI